MNKKNSANQKPNRKLIFCPLAFNQSRAKTKKRINEILSEYSGKIQRDSTGSYQASQPGKTIIFFNFKVNQGLQNPSYKIRSIKVQL